MVCSAQNFTKLAEHVCRIILRKRAKFWLADWLADWQSTISSKLRFFEKQTFENYF